MTGGTRGCKAETEELVPCRADASVMAGVILYIVTRTWCKICRCVDAWGGSRFALRLTLSRQPLPPTLAPLWRHSRWARGTGRSDRAPFPGRIIPIGSSLSLEGGAGAKPREAGRTWLPREARSCAGTCLEKRVSRNALGQGHAGEPSSGRRRTYGANMDAYR